MISDKNDSRRDFLMNFGTMSSTFLAIKQGNRVRQLSKYTATGLLSTYMGLVDLTRHLLEEKNWNTFVLVRYGYTMLGVDPIPTF